MSSPPSTSQSLASLMLGGWTLLGDVCPVPACHTPLVRSRDASKYLCAKCNRDTRECVATSNVAGPSAPSPHKSVSAETTREREETTVSVVPRLAPPPQHVQAKLARESSAELIAAKMLQGWALIDEHCPMDSCGYCPLVRSRDKTTKFCCGCDMPVVTEHTVPALPVPVPGTIDLRKANTLSASATSAAPPTTQKTRQLEQKKDEFEDDNEDDVDYDEQERQWDMARSKFYDSLASRQYYQPLPADELHAGMDSVPSAAATPPRPTVTEAATAPGKQQQQQGYEEKLGQSIKAYATRSAYTLVKKLEVVRAALEEETDVERMGKLAASLAEVARAIQCARAIS
ncbi:hypothetical protein PPROV_000782400 [Pycnococcus provasolii]|uniref:Uncharacterized protein n=1 Tax=Pycnococcus provasolii TaxID=41880 RepID=A0A830HW27_9CHLO|nr:hypothetical protein PPROV_000782400 [Pycnococcus provasolii]|mmetsp:Transcript_5923/g.15390  ORF Transcript_5923/g.15390 Transcript_5923/m.15390 type:complete len:344 (-) Transcript_5923:670-1701(-)